MTLYAFWELAIRSIIFATGATLMAWACDIPPTWKSLAFMLFCSFWSGCVFDGWKSSTKEGSKDDSSAAAPRKAAADVMTPTEVAAAARKTIRKPTPEPED